MATKIIKLEMKGFKSFAHQTDMHFGDDFNVILGPNGSGKSNVIDALCFVLGKSSAKGLRAEKSANLIYNGGKSKKPAKEGEVAIYFDNTDGDFPVESKEVRLSRTVKASGQSVYKINDKKFTRSEVIDFLHSAKINPDGYNIILQGDIVRFVEMSADERRKILEEIADISVYEDKKHKALLELEKVEQSLKEAHIILKERDSYLKDLEKEKAVAEKYHEYESTVKRGKATLLSKNIAEKQAKVDEIMQKDKTHIEQKASLEKAISELKQDVSQKHARIKEINNQIEEQGDRRQVEIHKQIEQLKVDIATNMQKKENVDEEVKRVTLRKQQLSESKKDIDEKIAQLKDQIKQNNEKTSTDKKTIEQIKTKIAEFKKKNNMDGSVELESQIEAIDKKIEDTQRSVDEKREKYQDLLRQKDRLEMQIANADSQIEKVAGIAKEHKAELEKLKQKRVEFKKITVELSHALKEDSSLASQVATARGRLHTVNEELAKLQAQKASIQETLGGSLAISKLIEQKNKIKGIHGTVSSLGTVGKKYAKALEVAAGAKIKALVVENDRVAQECISFLKKNRLGVATFLPMNKIKVPTRSPEAIKAAQRAHGFASELVKYDKKFKVVFDHVFGNSVIVDDLNQARTIGIGTCRMVTLDGDVAETSGVMQGGFRKNTTSLSFTQQEVSDKSEKLEAEASDLQSVLNNVTTKREANDGKITRLRELKATLEGEIIKTEKSLHLDDADLEMSKNLKKEFNQELTKVEKDFSSLQQVISQANRELANAKIEKQKLRSQMSDVRNPAKLAELNTFEEKLSELKDDMIRFESESKHLDNQIQNILLPEKENIDKIIKQQDKEVSEFKERAASLADQISQQKNTLKEQEAKEKEFYEAFKKVFDERNGLLKEVDKLESQIIKKDEDLRDIERRSNVLSIEVAKFKAEISVLEDELKEFKQVEVYEEDISLEDLKKRVYVAEQKLAEIGPVNLKAIEMFDRVKEEYEKLVSKKEILTSEKENVLVMINEIEMRKKDLFLKVFDRINKNFQRIFQSISTKGEAFIELENPEDPFAGGVNVKVKLSGNKFMDIRSLSGGEKTMTALAFIFAIQENEPSSFYIMDEVDAALDKKNAEKLASLIREHTEKAQYVVISHNDGVISAADHLYGVSMDQTSGISKVVSLKL